MMFAYLVEVIDPSVEADRRGLSLGTRELPASWGTRALAEELCREVRVKQPWTGTMPVRCSLWLHDGETPLPVLDMTAPSHAETYEYGRPA